MFCMFKLCADISSGSGRLWYPRMTFLSTKSRRVDGSTEVSFPLKGCSQPVSINDFPIKSGPNLLQAATTQSQILDYGAGFILPVIVNSYSSVSRYSSINSLMYCLKTLFQCVSGLLAIPVMLGGEIFTVVLHTVFRVSRNSETIFWIMSLSLTHSCNIFL